MLFFLLGKNIFWLASLCVTADDCPHRCTREHMGYLVKKWGEILDRGLSGFCERGDDWFFAQQLFWHEMMARKWVENKDESCIWFCVSDVYRAWWTPTNTDKIARWASWFVLMMEEPKVPRCSCIFETAVLLRFDKEKLSWMLSYLLSGHQLRSFLVYPINSASFLALSLFPLWVGMQRKSALTGHDLNTDVFSISMGM